MLFFFLVEIDALEGEFDLVGFFIGMELLEGLDEAGHERCTGFDTILLIDLLAGILAPFNRLFLRVLTVVSEVEDVGALELEGPDIGDLELTAVLPFFGKDGNGFLGCGVNDGVYLSLDGFLLDAQVAQGL